MTVEFKFSIGEKVIVKEIQRPGRVTALRSTVFGIDVLVCYWNDGQRREEWLYEDEIEPRTK